MRRTLRWLHRWLGLAAGAVLAAVSLSGTVLIFQWPLLALQYPQLAAQTPPPATQAAQAIPRILEDWSARGLSAFDFPRAELPVWQLYFKDGTRRYLDAHDAALVLERRRDNDVLLWLRELHVHLLAGKAGEQALGVLGFVALFLLGTGVWQWWPRNHRLLASLRPRSNPPPRRWVSWHRSAGVIGLPLTLLLVVTGVAMIYNAPTRAGLRAVFGDGPEVVAPTPVARSAAVIDWPAVVAAAQAALPDARLSRISRPKDGSAIVQLRARRPGEWNPNGRSLIWVHLETAQVLQVHDATRQGLGARISEAIYPMHGAFVGGSAWTALMTLGGLVLPALFLTGLLFWLACRPRPRRR